ncbi:negative regulation of sodium-dependent phosphate transport [Desmophyllum pertusum]|uniref:Negative regulation of sodium-dependent phosphate transport n=1 Tax=Desmophyllum pertusum TaxID=174260 RepID=A0A9W9ZLL8_9CNID|nr:negative regulation of sodium-dependent phosphate transport [Desmophyllum pertusum]
MFWVWLLSLLAITFHATDGFRFNPPQKCEKINVPLCHRVLPYNLTRFPNLRGHRSQSFANNSIQSYGPLIQRANCSKDAVFFLCSFHLPICLPGIEEDVIKPCRSLCERIKKDCAAVLEYWPSFVKCDELPEFSDGVCIQPESFIPVSQPTRSVNFINSCEDRPLADYNLYASGQYDYVIKFKVILTERRENQETIIRGKVIRVFSHTNVTIHKGRVKIWSNTTCSSLGTGKVFLIGGHENASRQKLLLSSKSLIEAWSGETQKKIKKWQRIEKKLGTKKGVKRNINRQQ